MAGPDDTSCKSLPCGSCSDRAEMCCTTKAWVSALSEARSSEGCAQPGVDRRPLLQARKFLSSP